jgi:hypothetical protein
MSPHEICSLYLLTLSNQVLCIQPHRFLREQPLQSNISFHPLSILRTVAVASRLVDPVPCVPLPSHGGVASICTAEWWSSSEGSGDSLTHTSPAVRTVQQTTHPQHLTLIATGVPPIWVSMRSEFTLPFLDPKHGVTSVPCTEAGNKLRLRFHLYAASQGAPGRQDK